MAGAILALMRFLRCLIVLAPILACAADFPFAGTWKIDHDKSKFSIGDPPRTLTVTLVGVDGGFMYSSENLDNPAKPGGIKYKAKFDAGDVVLPPGDRGYDAVEVHKINAQSFRVRSKLSGVVVGETVYTLGVDGKTFVRAGHLKKGDKDNQYREVFNRVN
jgi:hypothetical protein